LIESEYQLPVT